MFYSLILKISLIIMKFLFYTYVYIFNNNIEDDEKITKIMRWAEMIDKTLSIIFN